MFETMDLLAGDLRASRLRLTTEVELEVIECGPMDGEPVLLLHGYADSWFSYSRVLEALPSHIRAIVPTQRGHGTSEQPASGYRVSDFAADAVAVLDALAIERADVVGHSMGSFIAQRMAIEYPARVNRLVLIGSGTTARTPPIVELNAVVQELTDPFPRSFAREFQEGMLAQPVPPAFLDAVVRESERLPARVWRDVLAGLVAPEATHPLERIKALTLILWGANDTVLSRSEQDGLMRAIYGARLIVYGDLGHSPHWEEPARVAADLRDFLTQSLVSSTAAVHNRGALPMRC